MTQRVGTRLGAVLFIAAAAILLSSCTATVKPDGAAQAVVDLVSEQTGFKPTDVKCPSGVEAKVGEEFECQFTGPEGPYTAHMKVTKVDGDDVEFWIETRPSA
jgi:hypothetical protein